MSALCYLVADVHLQPYMDEPPPLNQAFLSFLNQWATEADQLYILGDLFEAWTGDDVCRDLYRQEIKALRQLSAQGTQVYLAFGNRAFLMRQDFWKATGITPIADSHVAQIQGQSYLLMHGDRLCTDDKDYQKLRKWLRNPVIQFLYLSLPKRQRAAIAHKLRRQSKDSSAQKQQQIMDVNAQAVQQCFQRHPDIKHLIHGHTHRPACHRLNIDATTHFRWVLGDWRPEAKLIKIAEGHIELIDYKPYDGLENLSPSPKS